MADSVIVVPSQPQAAPTSSGGSGIAIAVAVIALVGIAGFAYYEYSKTKTKSPPGDVVANSDGSCPTGYSPDPLNPGYCMVTQVQDAVTITAAQGAVSSDGFTVTIDGSATSSQGTVNSIQYSVSPGSLTGSPNAFPFNITFPAAGNYTVIVSALDTLGQVAQSTLAITIGTTFGLTLTNTDITVTYNNGILGTGIDSQYVYSPSSTSYVVTGVGFGTSVNIMDSTGNTIATATSGVLSKATGTISLSSAYFPITTTTGYYLYARNTTNGLSTAQVPMSFTLADTGTTPGSTKGSGSGSNPPVGPTLTSSSNVFLTSLTGISLTAAGFDLGESVILYVDDYPSGIQATTIPATSGLNGATWTNVLPTPSPSGNITGLTFTAYGQTSQKTSNALVIKYAFLTTSTSTSTINVSPKSFNRASNTSITVSGSGFAPNSKVGFTLEPNSLFGGGNITSAATTSSNGSFTNSWAYPGSGVVDKIIANAASNSVLSFTATDTNNNHAVATFTVV